MNKNLFICHTPYHITLAIAIIKEKNIENNVLVIFNTFNIDNKQINIINKYFMEVSILSGDSSEIFNKKYSIYEWIKKIKNNYNKACEFDVLLNKLKKDNYSRIFFSNNTYIEVQILLYKLYNKNIEICYIEDGSAAYHDIKYIEKNFNIKKFLKPNYLIYNLKYKFFFKFKVYSALGLGRNVKFGYYLQKKYIREDLKVLKSNNINLEKYKETIREFYNNNFKINNSIIIIMELSESGYDRKTIDIIKFLKDKKKNVFIKYHPRESSFYADNLIDKNIKKLDSNINMESILVDTEGNIVIGSGISTAFITLPLISKNKFIITSKIFEISCNNRYKSIIKQLGCIEIENIDDLNELILNL